MRFLEVIDLYIHIRILSKWRSFFFVELVCVTFYSINLFFVTVVVFFPYFSLSLLFVRVPLTTLDLRIRKISPTRRWP